MKFDKEYWDRLDEEIPGWQAEAEGRFLVKNVTGKSYVEIGVAYGKSIKLIGHHYPGMNIAGIDLINHAVVPVSGVIHHGDSVELSGLFKHESLDTLFIDGDHTYDGVMRDILCWWPKVKKGGTIIFHDYKRDKMHEGVTLAVDAIKSQLSRFRYDKCIAAGEKN